MSKLVQLVKFRDPASSDMLAEIYTGIEPVVNQMFTLIQKNVGDKSNYGRENSEILDTAEELELQL